MTSDPQMSDEIDEAIDWQGEPVECESCPHLELRNAGKCQPLARLRASTATRDASIVSSIGTRSWARDTSSIPISRSGPAPPKPRNCSCCRRCSKIPKRPCAGAPRAVSRNATFSSCASDSHREVRIRVAQRLDPEDLPVMMFDDDYAVRQIVARRVAAPLLTGMICDPDVEVRRVVAQRIPAFRAHGDDRR